MKSEQQHDKKMSAAKLPVPTGLLSTSFWQNLYNCKGMSGLKGVRMARNWSNQDFLRSDFCRFWHRTFSEDTLLSKKGKGE